MRLLLEKYFIIPIIKISLFRELFANNPEIGNHEIIFIGEINDYRMIRQAFGKRMYFIDDTKGTWELEKIRRTSDYFYIITSGNYLQWINGFEKKDIGNWTVIPLYDVRFSI